MYLCVQHYFIIHVYILIVTDITDESNAVLTLVFYNNDHQAENIKKILHKKHTLLKLF